MSLAWPLVRGAVLATPPGWTVGRVGDLVELINGYPFDSAIFSSTGEVPLVRIRDLLATEFETYVSGDVPGRFTVRDGDVVIGMDGDFNVVRWERGPAALNQRLCLLRPRPGVDIRFVYYWLPTLLRVLNDLAYSTTVKHLSSNEVLAERLLLPSLKEQRRIAGFLDDQVALLDRAIGLRQQQIDLLNEHLAAEASARLVREDLLHDGIQVRYLISSIKTGGTPSAREQWVWEDGLVPWYGPGAVGTGLILQQAAKAVAPEALNRNILPRFRRGSLLVVGIGATAGRVAYLDHDATGNQQMTCLTPKEGVESRFLAWSLWTRRQALLKTAPFTTLPILNNETLKSVRVLDLPRAEQRAIAVRLDGLQQKQDAFAQLASKSVRLLEERKQAIITAAVTGEFDVTTARSVA